MRQHVNREWFKHAESRRFDCRRKTKWNKICINDFHRSPKSGCVEFRLGIFVARKKAFAKKEIKDDFIIYVNWIEELSVGIFRNLTTRLATREFGYQHISLLSSKQTHFFYPPVVFKEIINLLIKISWNSFSHQSGFYFWWGFLLTWMHSFGLNKYPRRRKMKISSNSQKPNFRQFIAIEVFIET